MGELWRLRGGKLSFRYLDTYLQDPEAVPLSLSMPPLDNVTYGDDKVSPFLWNLLPDNELILQRWARRFQVSASNCFALLQAIGEDCAGAIRFMVPDRPDAANQGGRDLLSIQDIEHRLADLLRDPALGRTPEDRGQFSLAGAQAKTALQRIGTKWYLPWGAEPTTHIVKPPRPDLDGHVENEHFCLRLAATLGIQTARSEVLRFGQQTAIVVERYDRVTVNGKLLRVHQEDACQSLTIHPAHKYQSDGGPGVEDLMRLLNRSSQPHEDRRRFMQALAFNYLILGSDAHAKNFSLLLGRRGQVRLAPLYDLASLLPYTTQRKERRFAMKIGRSYRDDQVQPRHFVQMAQRCEYPAKAIADQVIEMADRIPAAAEATASEMESQGVHHPVLDTLVSQLKARSERIAANFAEHLANGHRRPI